MLALLVDEENEVDWGIAMRSVYAEISDNEFLQQYDLGLSLHCLFASQSLLQLQCIAHSISCMEPQADLHARQSTKHNMATEVIYLTLLSATAPHILMRVPMYFSLTRDGCGQATIDSLLLSTTI